MYLARFRGIALKINDFRISPLSDKIVNALIEATQAHMKMDVLINEYPTIKPVLSDALLSLDTHYGFFDIQPDIRKICHSLYVLGQTDTPSKIINIIAASMGYAQDKVQKTGILTAGDLLRIDEAIKTANSKPLAAGYCSIEDERKVETIWPILHDLYGPQRQYPLLLETAIACYRFLTFSVDSRIDLLSQAILFSTVHRNNLSFQGLHRQWILSTDPQISLASIDMEDALIHILYVFQRMWAYTTALVRKVNNKREEISQFIKASIPHQIPTEFYHLLTENICIRNRDVSKKLRISPKTAIKHLKMLELEKALYSVKSGREVFYFNNLLIDLLKESIEVHHNGPEKP